MSQNFQAGDFLLFQIESGFALLRILAIDEAQNGGRIWHLAAYEELFLDSEMADSALATPENLSNRREHMVLTQRAFEATQVARMGNHPLSEEEKETVRKWRKNPAQEVSDRSARLMLGLR